MQLGFRVQGSGLGFKDSGCRWLRAAKGLWASVRKEFVMIYSRARGSGLDVPRCLFVAPALQYFASRHDTKDRVPEQHQNRNQTCATRSSCWGFVLLYRLV